MGIGLLVATYIAEPMSPVGKSSSGKDASIENQIHTHVHIVCSSSWARPPAIDTHVDSDDGEAEQTSNEHVGASVGVIP